MDRSQDDKKQREGEVSNRSSCTSRRRPGSRLPLKDYYQESRGILFLRTGSIPKEKKRPNPSEGGKRGRLGEQWTGLQKGSSPLGGLEGREVSATEKKRRRGKEV